MIQWGHGPIFIIISQLKLLKLDPCWILQYLSWFLQSRDYESIIILHNVNSTFCERIATYGKRYLVLIASPFEFPYASCLAPDPANSRFPGDLPTTGTSANCGCAQSLPL